MYHATTPWQVQNHFAKVITPVNMAPELDERQLRRILDSVEDQFKHAARNSVYIDEVRSKPFAQVMFVADIEEPILTTDTARTLVETYKAAGWGHVQLANNNGGRSHRLYLRIAP